MEAEYTKGEGASSQKADDSLDDETSNEVATRDFNSAEDEYGRYGNFFSRSLYLFKCHWKIFLLGQIMSLLLAGGSATQATLHLDCGLSAPTFTMGSAYFLQGIIHGFLLITRQRKEQKQQRQLASNTHQVVVLDEQQYNFLGLQLRRPVWQYGILSFLDAQANALTLLSFRYTTLTSVTLLDALAIPAAMIISRLFLGRRYTWLHLTGLVVCMVGVIFNVYQDTDTDVEDNQSNENSKQFSDDGAYPHKVWGDFLAASGGVLYGVNDVLSEATVRGNNGIIEYLTVVGIFGCLISFLQASIFERNDTMEFFERNPDTTSTCSIAKGWFLYVLFVGVTVSGYIGGTKFLMISEAAFFNLSLLTGDLWSVAFSIFAEHIVPQPLFYVALFFVLCGVVLYEMAPHPVLEDQNIDQAANQLADIDHEFELQFTEEDWQNESNSDENEEEQGFELL